MDEVKQYSGYFLDPTKCADRVSSVTGKHIYLSGCEDFQYDLIISAAIEANLPTERIISAMIHNDEAWKCKL